MLIRWKTLYPKRNLSHPGNLIFVPAMSAEVVLSDITAKPEILSEEKVPLRNANLHLSMEIRENEFIASILNKERGRYVAFARYPLSEEKSALSSALSDEFFRSSFSGASVSFSPNSSILVPAAYYNIDYLNKYLGLPLPAQSDELPCSDHLKSIDSYNLYTANKIRLAALREIFPAIQIRHHTTIFIEDILRQEKGAGGSSVYVSVFKRYMYIAVVRSGSLALCNRFSYTSLNDFLYYLLWVYEQLQLDCNKDGASFFGEVTAEQLNAARQYLKTAGVCKTVSGLSCAGPLERIPQNQYRLLFDQYLCV